MPANTGAAGAIHRIACFAGMPAPTVIAPASVFNKTATTKKGTPGGALFHIYTISSALVCRR